MGPLQDELPSGFDQKVASVALMCSLVYRELQKSGRKSAGAKSKGSASTPVTDPANSMGPPQSIPKKGKGTTTVVPMSQGGENTQGQPADTDMDVDAEMDDVDDVDEANGNESREEDEDDEGEEEEDEEPVDQMAVEDEELRRDTEGLDLHNPQPDMDKDV